MTIIALMKSCIAHGFIPSNMTVKMDGMIIWKFGPKFDGVKWFVLKLSDQNGTKSIV